MRVVYVSYYRAVGYSGPNQWLKRINFFTPILSALADHADVHSINVLGCEESFIRENVTYHFLRSGRLNVARRVNDEVIALQPDIVIIHGLLYPHYVITLASRLRKSASIYIQHHGELPLKGVRKFFQRLADRFVKAYFFTSSDLARPWIDKGMIRGANKIHEVMEVTSIFSNISIEKHESPFHKRDVNYLWVGRLDENKNPLLMAKAFIEFAHRHNDVTLSFIFQTNTLLRDVETIVNASNVADRIRLIGKIEHEKMGEWYHCSDFIVSTSFMEGSGVAVTEAMSCGTWPIVTKIPAFEKMTNNGEAGTLFTTGDQKSLLDALERSYVLDRSLAREKVLSFHKANHSAAAIARSLFKIFTS